MGYAGLDVGTSGCKITVYDLDGQVLYQAARRYRETGSSGYRELDGEMVAAQVLDLLSQVGHECTEKVEAIAVSSLGESVVCLDETGRSLAPSMLTGDSRGIAQTQWLIEKMGQARIMEITGLPPNELYSLPKWIWLNETGVIAKTKQMFFYEDYIGYLLTGKRMVSYSSACRSMAFDIRKKEWSEELLSLAGIVKDQLSQPMPAGTVIGEILPEMAQQTGLNPHMKVVVGGHDQSCAAIGSGLYDASGCETSMGTCEFALFMLPGARADQYMIDNNFPCIPYVLEDTYLTSLEVTTCGILKNWGRDTLFSAMAKECEEKDQAFFVELEKKLEGLETEVLALPQFGSAGNPDLSMDARGTFAGLSIHTKPEEMYLALLEGMTFQMYYAYERLQKLGVAPSYMVANGGGAASKLTLQIRADVFGLQVRRLSCEETGTLGCMLLAATAVGAYASLEEAIARAVRVREVYEPDAQAHSRYMQKYEKYKVLYERMYDFK